MNSEEQHSPQQTTERRFEPWPTAIVIFFVVVFIANAIMIMLGRDSWPGLVSKNHYQQGLSYNKVINAQKAQDRLGWSFAIEGVSQLVAGESGDMVLRLSDSTGKPVRHAQVEGILFRPLGEGVDLGFLMQENAPGLYSTTLTPPLPGAWDIKIRVQKTAAVDLRYVERITVANN